LTSSFSAYSRACSFLKLVGWTYGSHEGFSLEGVLSRALDSRDFGPFLLSSPLLSDILVVLLDGFLDLVVLVLQELLDAAFPGVVRGQGVVGMAITPWEEGKGAVESV
jgi:hypothetical protein